LRLRRENYRSSKISDLTVMRIRRKIKKQKEMCTMGFLSMETSHTAGKLIRMLRVF